MLKSAERVESGRERKNWTGAVADEVEVAWDGIVQSKAGRTLQECTVPDDLDGGEART